MLQNDRLGGYDKYKHDKLLMPPCNFLFHIYIGPNKKICSFPVARPTLVATLNVNIEGIPRNACGASGDISIWYLMCMIAKSQGVKEKDMSHYTEYESPVCYCRKVMSRV